jgi:hypothetical protein
MLYKHGLAQAVYLELMQQKKPLELIFKLYEVTKPNMLYKYGLTQVVYLELMQQEKSLELMLIFKFYKIHGKHRKQNSFTLLNLSFKPRY